MEVYIDRSLVEG